MFTSSHHRIPRSNGFKVKHALQICIVLGVCIWLIYQVGHSGEDTKTVNEAVKLNRKDLHSHVDESSVIDTRQREEESEEGKRNEEQNKRDDTNGVEDEILMQKHEENNIEGNYEHRQDSIDQETEESSVKSSRDNESEEHNQYSSQENDNMANKENEQNIKEVEDNDKIQEVASSEDRAQDGEMNNEVPRDEHYTSTNASSATEAANVDQKESVSNVTESETTEVPNYNNITTKQGNSSEDQAVTQNDSQKSSIADSSDHEQEQNKLSEDGVETLHLLNGTDTTSTTTERQIETSEKSNSKVSDSTSSLNNTMLKAEDSNSDSAREEASPSLTDSSGIHESNVTNVEYRDTSGNFSESEIPNNYSIQEGIPEHALSPNTNSNKDASREVQFVSSNNSSELKNVESSNSKFENSINSGGSANNNIENNGNENANDSDVVPLKP